MDLNFFGLSPKTAPQIRKNLFTEIHEIVFHGKGGYDWETVYNMPIWLRKYTFSQIDKFHKDQNEASTTSTGSTKKNMIPEFLKGKTSYK